MINTYFIASWRNAHQNSRRRLISQFISEENSKIGENWSATYRVPGFDVLGIQTDLLGVRMSHLIAWIVYSTGIQLKRCWVFEFCDFLWRTLKLCGALIVRAVGRFQYLLPTLDRFTQINSLIFWLLSSLVFFFLSMFDWFTQLIMIIFRDAHLHAS